MTEENFFEEQEKTNSADSQDDANVAEAIQKVSEEQNNEPEDSVFDYTKLSKEPGKKYDRKELNGQTVTIKGAKILNPTKADEWGLTLKKDKETKKYGFLIEYDTENNDREYMSGLQGYKNDDGSLGDPTLYFEGKNQVAKLFQAYRTFVMAKDNVDAETFKDKYGLHKFVAFLNSNPKVIIETVEIDFMNKIHKKNLVKSFV